MGKIKYFILALLLGPLMVNANPVLEATAVKIAIGYYTQSYNVSAGKVTLVYTEHSSDGLPVFYVYNINSTEGFVIVSAEDAGSPILGSSNEGGYVIPTANTNAEFWINRRKNEIISMRASNIQATSVIIDKWNALINNTESRNIHSAVSSAPSFLCTTIWNQTAPYNDMCPGASSSQAITGCVATAMAQIMRYWQYPSVGKGSSCYDENGGYYWSENYGQLCAEYDTAHYVWSVMPNGVALYSSEIAKAQIAKLIYDCGVSVDMNYSPTVSLSQVIGQSYGFYPTPCAQVSYVQYFGYDSLTIQGLYKYAYSMPKWEGLIINEINNKRPVQYLGQDTKYGGHTWVCDGYKVNPSDTEFHMNWGWGGADDGWYLLGDLNPGSYDFSDGGDGMLIGIEPPAGKGILAVQQVTDNKEITVYPNPSHGVFTFDIPNNNSNYQINIYNVLGQEVNAAIINSTKGEINLTTQPKGVYIYRVSTETGEAVLTGRFIIE